MNNNAGINQTMGYTSEENAQLLLSLLKQHGIRRVIASPGATNVAVVASMQHDSFFEMYSCVDERSAAYMACGMVEESGEPVVLSCTGATSSRNYMPGLTEAFYRKLPILAITSSMENNRLGHLYPQFTDRSNPPSDCVKKTYHVQVVKDEEDRWDSVIKLNDAILELTHGQSGPVHINLETVFAKDFSVQSLPIARRIKRLSITDCFPDIPDGKIAVFIGQHKPLSVEESAAIDLFCSRYDAVVLTDHTSSFHGRYRVLSSFLASQECRDEDLLNVDLLIHVGEISGDYYTFGSIRPKEVWRVCSDGALRDRFRKLTNVFEMTEEQFFTYYSQKKESINLHAFLDKWNSKTAFLRDNMPELPFSTLWVASVLSSRIPKDSTLYLSILNVLRSWNFFEVDNSVRVVSNVGGFGIDGMMSSVVGASLVNPKRLYIGVTGDLNFFYDINILGNRHLGNNVRILLINNGHGQEFRTYNHAAAVFGEDTDRYIAASGHFGNKSHSLVKEFAKSLGFTYLSADNKESFLQEMNGFVSVNESTGPILLEVFTNNDEEYDSLRMMRNIIQKPEKGFMGKMKDICVKIIEEIS